MVDRLPRRLWFMPPVLISEDDGEQLEILRQLEQEIQPRTVIERMYLGDIAAIAFEIMAIINTSYRAAVQNVLAQLLRKPGEFCDDIPEKAEALALAWFTREKGKEEVSKILNQFHLDESAIEAEAIRRSFADLEQIEGVLA